MDQLQNALKGALSTTTALKAREIPVPPSKLPDPLSSEWGQLLRQLGAAIPSNPSIGQLRQRSDALYKELKQRDPRQAQTLQKARDQYEKARDKAAWDASKELFEKASLPERAWRALKQSTIDPVQLLERLEKHAESLQGQGADRVRDFLLGK